MGVTTVDRGGCKFGVYLGEELCLELKKLVEGGGRRARSRIIQEALRLYIAEGLWREVNGYVIGSLNVLYNHKVEGVDARLTDVQHEYADVVVSALHVHLDPRTCLLVIAVRGSSERVRELVKNLERISGVLLVRPIVVLATPREAGVEVEKGKMP
jgi:CopG family nickel-responsive transcriptional regulator